MKRLYLLLLTATLTYAAQGGKVDIYSAQDLHAMGDKLVKKGTQFAAEDLEHYGTHHTMFAEREQTGSAEVHEHEADFFVVESGTATLVSGGKIAGPHTEKPGEIRGSSIEGGDRHRVATGDIVHLPAGVPHQLLVDKGTPFTYFVIKVKDE